MADKKTSKKNKYGNFYKADGEKTVLHHNNGKIEIPPKGSLIHIITPEQQEQRRKNSEKAKQAEKYNEHIRNMSYKHGGFTFLRTDCSLNELKPQTAGRLVYLATYLDYDNLLLTLDNRPMLKKDLPKVLNLTRVATNDFYKECLKNKMLIDKGIGGLYMSDTFFRGVTTNNNQTRLYRKTIQNLYRQMNPKSHRFFGFIVLLIPLINKEWNIICNNPDEKDISKVRCLTIKEICEQLNYDQSNAEKLKTALTGCWFEWNGNKQSICAIIKALSCGKSFQTIIVNPHIIYAGLNHEQVEAFGAYFPIKTKKSNEKQ